MKIVSWNIAGGRKIKTNRLFEYEKENLDYFVEQLSLIGIDIICLQEVHTKKEYCVAEKIASSLKMDYIFNSPASISHIDNSFQLGNAIISRFPFKETFVHTYPLPNFDLHFPDGKKVNIHNKNLQVVMIDNFYIANTQMLGLFEYRFDQGLGLNHSKALEKTLIKLEQPIILCGDFNYNDPQKIYPNLFEKLSLKESLPNKTTRPNPDGLKLTPDHILHSPDFNLISSNVIKTSTDHYLCYANFEN